MPEGWFIFLIRAGSAVAAWRLGGVWPIPVWRHRYRGASSRRHPASPIPMIRVFVAQENSCRVPARHIFNMIQSISIRLLPSRSDFLDAKGFGILQIPFADSAWRGRPPEEKCYPNVAIAPRKQQRKIRMTPRSTQIVPTPSVLAALIQRRDGATCPVGIGPPASRQPAAVRIGYLTTAIKKFSGEWRLWSPGTLRQGIRQIV